ncbi:MAG: YncE family protein [candidate division Zixibacteria bacterium]|nr:YncE family protein [candidate division Zixibacteria bacterium]
MTRRTRFAGWIRAALVAAGCLLLTTGCPSSETTITEDLYVLNENDTTLSIFTVPGLESAGAPIKLASLKPHHLSFDPNHSYFVVVSRVDGGHVNKYDAATKHLLATSSLRHFYTGVDVDPAGQYVYVTDFGGGSSSQRTKIYKLHVDDLEAKDSITAGARPHSVAVSHNGNVIVAADAGSDEITLYFPNESVESDVFNIAVPDPDSAVELGHPVWEPYGLALSDDDSLAYLACRKSKSAGQAAIFVFDIPNRRTVDTIFVPWSNRSGASTNYHLGLCILLDQSRYLAATSQDGNSVYLIDTRRPHTYVEKVFGQNITFGVTATADEKYICVTANNGNKADPKEVGWVYELRRVGGNLTLIDSVKAGMLPNGCHVKHAAHQHG